MEQFEIIHESLITLGLEKIEHTVDNYLENAKDKNVMEILDILLSDELMSQRSKRYETRLKYAGFPFRKTME